MSGSKKCFVDSNVWIYLFDRDKESTNCQIASKLISKNEVFLSVQVVNEVGNNLIHPEKPFKFTEEKLRTALDFLYSVEFNFVGLTRDVYFKASEMREKTKGEFSYYDSLVVSAALLAGTEILYSQDMGDESLAKELRALDFFFFD